MILESLPRSESSLLSVKLGGLFLRDLTTQGTIFPVLVSPKMVSSDSSRIAAAQVDDISITLKCMLYVSSHFNFWHLS